MKKSGSIFGSVLAISAMHSGAFAQQAAPKPVPRATFAATMDGQFKAIDTNKDNVLSTAEIETFQRTQGAAIVERQTSAMFTQLDTNKDGSISRAEFEKIASTAAIKPDAGPMLAQMDANKDGKISIAEFRAATNANFAKIDTNGDGIVSPDELRASAPKR